MDRSFKNALERWLEPPDENFDEECDNRRMKNDY